MIVVITILAILGTVGFVSIQGLSANTRNGARASDVNSVIKSIDVSNIKTGSYPAPDSSFSVTYSGWVVWNQGVFGTTALTKLSWVGINKAPTDPVSNVFYTYSLLASGNAYQLKADYESSWNAALANIKGNYGWLTAKSFTWGIFYVLAVPGIITNTGSLGQSLEITNNSLSGTLIMDGLSSKTGITYNPNKVVFSWATIPTTDTGSGITNMMIAFQNAYTWVTTLTTPNSPVQTVLSTPLSALAPLWVQIISNQLGGRASIASSVIAPTWSIAWGGSCDYVDNTLWSNGNTAACTDSRTYTMQGGATHTKTYNLLKIAGKWWFNQNLAYPIPSGYRGSNTWSTTDAGYYSCPGNNNSTTVDCSLVSTRWYPYQWSAAMAGGVSTNNQTSRTQWICPSGWGIPTKSDFATASNAYWPDSINDYQWLGNTVWWISTLVWYRDIDVIGTFQGLSVGEYIWTSFEDSSLTAWNIYFQQLFPAMSSRNIDDKAYGLSVRCIKN